jgi:hypothetical protein
MKDIKSFITESTQSEDLQDEISLALKDFGNIRHGFKMTPIDDIKDAMYKAGFDFDEDQSSDEKLVFVGEYIDTQYEVYLYAADHVSGKFKIKNFNVMVA